MDSQLIRARIEDTYNLCTRSCVPHFLGFLTESEAAVADEMLKKFGADYRFWGGYEQAQRTMLVCLPDWCDAPDYPIVSVTVKFRECDKLGHRDFLGSLMSLGITRESIGDILVESGRAVLFLNDDIADYVISQIYKIGRVGVTLSKGFEEPLPEIGKLISMFCTVASLRLDCVVSALAGVSRNVACEMIETGLVSVNSIVCEKVTRIVAAGERITIRGKGKFLTDDVSATSKKGRIIFKYSVYS